VLSLALIGGKDAVHYLKELLLLHPESSPIAEPVRVWYEGQFLNLKKCM
jgi:hypothetical protein